MPGTTPACFSARETWSALHCRRPDLARLKRRSNPQFCSQSATRSFVCWRMSLPGGRLDISTLANVHSAIPKASPDYRKRRIKEALRSQMLSLSRQSRSQPGKQQREAKLKGRGWHRASTPPLFATVVFPCAEHTGVTVFTKMD